MSQPLKSDDRTIQLDTRNGPGNGGLNLDFLDLPDDPGATVPAQPSPPPSMGAPSPGPSPAQGPTPSQGPIPSSLPMPGSYPAPAAAPAPPSALSSLSVFGGGVTSQGQNPAGRVLKLGGLFVASFLIMGGLVYVLGSGGDENDYAAPPAPQSVAQAPAQAPAGTATPAGAPALPEEEPSFFDSLFAGVMEMLGLAEEAPPPPVTPPVKAKKEKAVVQAPPPEEEGDEVENVDVELRDPYRIISNNLDLEALEPLNQSRRKIGATEEQGWTAGLTHKFPYQHYRAVEEMRVARPEGSERILREALADSKLWVRMQAAFALAESGVELTTSEVEQAVGQRERRNLLNAYFKRFVRSNNMAERYVLKFSLPLVPDAARIDILRSLVNASDPDSGLYVIAATFDASPRVRRWAGDLLARNPSVLLRMDEYRAFLDAWELTDAFRPSVVAPRAGTSPAVAALSGLRNADRPVRPAEGAAAIQRSAGQGEAPAVEAGSIPDSPVEFYRVNR